MSVKSVMTALADQVRRLSGRSGTLSIEAMTTALNGIVDQGTKTATLDTSTTSYTIPAGKHSGSGKVSIATQEKSVTPGTSAQTVTPDSGKVLSKVSVGAVPSATQATPSITVSSGGLITASATQTAGYVAAGTKSATKQLTTKAATTITPTGSVQTAVAAGTYCIGDILVAASAGKTVYKGTVTRTGQPFQWEVDTGVTLAPNDTFLMIADTTEIPYGQSGYSGEMLACVFMLPVKHALFLDAAGVQWYDDVYFIGTKVQISLMSSTDNPVKYNWWIIKG